MSMSEEIQISPHSARKAGVDRRELLQRSMVTTGAGALMGELGGAAPFSGPRRIR